jgi:hypothetical protein
VAAEHRERSPARARPRPSRLVEQRAPFEPVQFGQHTSGEGNPYPARCRLREATTAAIGRDPVRLPEKRSSDRVEPGWALSSRCFSADECLRAGAAQVRRRCVRLCRTPPARPARRRRQVLEAINGRRPGGGEGAWSSRGFAPACGDGSPNGRITWPPSRSGADLNQKLEPYGARTYDYRPTIDEGRARLSAAGSSRAPGRRFVGRRSRPSRRNLITGGRSESGADLRSGRRRKARGGEPSESPRKALGRKNTSIGWAAAGPLQRHRARPLRTTGA